MKPMWNWRLGLVIICLHLLHTAWIYKLVCVCVSEVMFELLMTDSNKRQYAAAANNGLWSDVLLAGFKMNKTLRPISNLISI